MCCELHANRFANNTVVTCGVLTTDPHLDYRLTKRRVFADLPTLTLTYAVTWAPVRTPVTAPEVAEPVRV